MKNRTSRDTCLLATDLAIKKAPFQQIPCLFVATSWTNESTGPALIGEMLYTGIIIGKFLLKFDQFALYVIFARHLAPFQEQYQIEN
jgi:hypothetical protein